MIHLQICLRHKLEQGRDQAALWGQEIPRWVIYRTSWSSGRSRVWSFRLKSIHELSSWSRSPKQDYHILTMERNTQIWEPRQVTCPWVIWGHLHNRNFSWARHGKRQARREELWGLVSGMEQGFKKMKETKAFLELISKLSKVTGSRSTHKNPLYLYVLTVSMWKPKLKT